MAESFFKFKFTDTDGTVVWSDVLSTTSNTYEKLLSESKDWTEDWSTLANGILIVEIYCKIDKTGLDVHYWWKSPIVKQVKKGYEYPDHAITERRDNKRHRGDETYTKRGTWNMEKDYDFCKVFLEAKQAAPP